jgi:hypothetical protein
VIIEVKLAVNAESRRAVVAQVLSYAGYLQGLNPDQLEPQVLARHLPPGGTVLTAVEADDTPLLMFVVMESRLEAMGAWSRFLSRQHSAAAQAHHAGPDALYAANEDAQPVGPRA